MLTHWLPLLTYSLLSLMPLKMFSINIMQHLKYNWRCSEQPLTSELSESGTKKTNGILRFSSKHQNEEFMGPLLGHRLTAPDSLLWREGWSVWHVHLARIQSTSKVATGQMEFLGEKKAWLKVKGDRDAEKRKITAICYYSYLSHLSFEYYGTKTLFAIVEKERLKLCNLKHKLTICFGGGTQKLLNRFEYLTK